MGLRISFPSSLFRVTRGNSFIMKHVNIYKLNNDGTQAVVAVFRLSDDESPVFAEGDEVFIENISLQGIDDYLFKNGVRLFPKDGLPFLENLQSAFRSGYILASPIINDYES